MIRSQYENRPLKIMDMEISCAVLTDNTRVISQRGLNNALKRPQGGAGVGKMPVFLRAAALKDFISDDLRREILNPIEYIPLHGGRSAYGVKADLLDDICQAWIDASNAGKLTEKQEETAEKARALKRAVGKIGWIALVDEATGFQKFRDEKALESLLSLYISKEFLPWMKTFIEAFYEEIYRLKGWHYDPRKNKYQVVGRYTLKYVYGCLPKKVVDEVKNKTPRDKSGNYTKKLFQSLTNEVGKPHLDRALGGVIALLKAAPSWSAFERSYERVYGNQKDQLTLPIALEE